MGQRKSDNAMVGRTFGFLTVNRFAYTKSGRGFWECSCKCGNVVYKRSDALKDSSSCVECKSKKQRERMTTHGETKTWLYTTWRGIKSRCYNPNDIKSKNYLERGIKMYEPWINDYVAFKNYVSKLDNFGKDGYTLDRINNDGNYEPNNLRWATYSQQKNNTTVNRKLTLNGITKTSKEWSEELGIKYSTIQNRIHLGWSDEEVLTKEVKVHKKAV